MIKPSSIKMQDSAPIVKPSQKRTKAKPNAHAGKGGFPPLHTPKPGSGKAPKGGSKMSAPVKH